jgi:hypothetical protein
MTAKHEVAFCLYIFALTITLVGCTGSTDMSGTYVATGEHAAYLLQLVAKDGHLTGHFEEVRLRSDGELEDHNSSVIGDVSNGTIVATIKPIGMLSGSMAVSGAIEGGSMHLTGGGDAGQMDLTLTKADEAIFQKEVTYLRQQSQAIHEAKAKAEQQKKSNEEVSAFLGNLNSLIHRIDDFNLKVDQMPPRFQMLESDYRQATEKMLSKLDREQSIRGDGQETVVRGQISVSIHQDGNAALETHSGAEQATTRYQTAADGIRKDEIGIQQACGSIGKTTTKPITSTGQSLLDDCDRFDLAAKGFDDHIVTAYQMFAHVDQIWKSEASQQEKVQSESDKAVFGH